MFFLYDTFLIKIYSSLGSESVPSNISSLVRWPQWAQDWDYSSLVSTWISVVLERSSKCLQSPISAKLELQKIPCFGRLEITMDLG